MNLEMLSQRQNSKFLKTRVHR